MTEMHVDAQETAVSFGDGLVAFLSRLGMGGFAGGAVWVIVQLVRYGLGYFKIALPESPAAVYVIELVLLNLPWVLGVVVGFINYGKVLQLPDES